MVVPQRTPDLAILIDPHPDTFALVEGGEPVKFRLRLNTASDQPIAATLSNSAPSVVTLSMTEGMVDVKGIEVSLTPQDDDDAKNDTAFITLESELGTRSFSVTVVDDDAVNLVVTPASANLVEGGSTTVGLRLSARPEAAVAVSVAASDPHRVRVSHSVMVIDPETWNVPQTLRLEALEDDDLAGNAVDVAFGNPAGEGATVALTIADDDTQAFVLSTGAVSVGEGLTTSFAASLAFQPEEDVTVDVASTDRSIAAVGPATLTFTKDNFDQPQMIEVSGVADMNVTDEEAHVMLTSAGIDGAADVAVTVTDDDTQIIVVSTASVGVSERDAQSFTVRLGFQPPADTVVHLALSDPAKIAVTPVDLVFTRNDWNQDRLVNVIGRNDPDLEDEDETVTLSCPGAADVTVEVTVIEDDVQEAIINPSSATVHEGESGELGVRLMFPPLNTTRINVGAEGAISASPALLTFTAADWNHEQRVTVTGLQDQNVRDDLGSLRLSSLEIGVAAAPVLVIDDDEMTLLASPGAIVVPENGAGTFDLRLGFEPDGEVTVAVIPADPYLATAPEQLTFTAADWDLPQSITVFAEADANTTDDQSTITLVSADAAPVSVAVTVTDQDHQSILLDTHTLLVAENGASPFTARLAFEPASPITLAFSSSDPGAATVSPASLDFDASNWDLPRAITVSGTDDDDLANESVTVAVSGGGLAPDALAVLVTDDDAQAILADRLQVTVGEGDSEHVGVRLAFAPPAPVSINVASTDPLAVGLARRPHLHAVQLERARARHVDRGPGRRRRRRLGERGPVLDWDGRPGDRGDRGGRRRPVLGRRSDLADHRGGRKRGRGRAPRVSSRRRRNRLGRLLRPHRRRACRRKRDLHTLGLVGAEERLDRWPRRS